MAPGGRMAYFGPPAQALDYFGQHGAGKFYADVFTHLEEHPDVNWSEEFRTSPM